MQNYFRVAIIPQQDGSYSLYLPNTNSYIPNFKNLASVITASPKIVMDAYVGWFCQYNEYPDFLSPDDAVRDTEAFIKFKEIAVADKIKYLLLPVSNVEEKFSQFKVTLPVTYVNYIDEQAGVSGVSRTAILGQAILALQAMNKEQGGSLKSA